MYFIPAEVPDFLKQIVNNCWAQSTQDRPLFSGLYALQHDKNLCSTTEFYKYLQRCLTTKFQLNIVKAELKSVIFDCQYITLLDDSKFSW